MSNEKKGECPYKGSYWIFDFDKTAPPAGADEIICFAHPQCYEKFKRFPDVKSRDMAAKYEDDNPGRGCYVYYHE